MKEFSSPNTIFNFCRSLELQDDATIAVKERNSLPFLMEDIVAEELIVCMGEYNNIILLMSGLEVCSTDMKRYWLSLKKFLMIKSSTIH